MKIIYTHINTRTRKRTHTRARAFKYTHTVWWPLKVWYNIGCAGNSAYECRVPSVELGAPFGQLFMHACVCYACRVWCVCDAHDWCLPAPDCAFGVYFYVASFGRQPTKQPTNQPPGQRAQWKCCWFFYDSNQVKWICIIVQVFMGAQRVTSRRPATYRLYGPLDPRRRFALPSLSVSQPLSLLQSQCGSPNQVARIYIGQHLTKTVASLRETRARSRW